MSTTPPCRCSGSSVARHVAPFLRSAAPALTALVLLAALVARAQATPGHRTTSFNYSTDSDSPRHRDFAYALVGPDAEVLIGTWSDDQRARIRRAVGPSDRDLLWFSLRGEEYVVRDHGFISRAEHILGPMQTLGRQQGRLGAQQGMLGRQQGEIGREQARLGARMARLSTHRAWRPNREAEDVEREMKELGDQQRELARRHEPLSRRQGELGRQQAELGRQQAIATRQAESEMRQLAEEAIERGKAEPADE